MAFCSDQIKNDGIAKNKAAVLYRTAATIDLQLNLDYFEKLYFNNISWALPPASKVLTGSL